MRQIVGALWYPAVLLAGTAALRAGSPQRQQQWLRYASTDLINLVDHPLPALALSGIFVQGSLLPWLVLALVGLAVLGQRLGPGAAALLVVVVHVLATLGSQGLVAVRIAAGQLPDTDRRMLDVGASYLVTAGLVGAVAVGRGPGRWLALAGFALLAPSLFDGLPEGDLAAVGHVLSTGLAAGFALGWVRWRGRPRGSLDRTRAAKSEWPSADSNRGPG